MGAAMRRTVEMLRAWNACLLLSGLVLPAAAAQEAAWQAGAARVDTTPAAPVRMAGYASRTAPSQGVAHPLAAKALALKDARGHTVVLVTCDIIAFRRAFTNRVAE